MDQLPRSTEASVRESIDPRIIELIPGLQDVRKKTLPQMYFEDCSVLRGTYGRVNPLFQHPEDAVLLIWKPGDYDHVYFMFVSQLYPHHEQFHIHEWSMIVFSREMTGAIKRRVEDPPTQGSTPQMMAIQYIQKQGQVNVMRSVLDGCRRYWSDWMRGQEPPQRWEDRFAIPRENWQESFLLHEHDLRI